MQFVVDLNDESNTPEQLRQLACMLFDAADDIDGGEPDKTDGPSPPVLTLVSKVDSPPLDPAVVFARPTAAVPMQADPPASTVLVPTGTQVISPPPPTDIATAPIQLDRDGFPHDTRIHSATPTIKADGRWRQKRNLDNPTLVAVEAELRSRPAVRAAVLVPATVIPPPPPAIIPPPPAVVAAPNAPAPSVMVPPPPPVAAPVLPSLDAFRALMARIGPHTKDDGRLSNATMKPLHAQFGASTWADYMTKCADKVPALNALIDGLLA